MALFTLVASIAGSDLAPELQKLVLECWRTSFGSWLYSYLLLNMLWTEPFIFFPGSLLCCCCLVAKLRPSFTSPWAVSCQAPLSMGFPRQEYWSGLPFPSPGDTPNPGIKLSSPVLPGGFFTTESPTKPRKPAIPLYLRPCLLPSHTSDLEIFSLLVHLPHPTLTQVKQWSNAV